MRRAALLLTLVGAVPSTVFGHTTPQCCDDGSIFQGKEAGEFVCGDSGSDSTEGIIQTFPSGGELAWVQKNPAIPAENGFLHFSCRVPEYQITMNTKKGLLPITDQVIQDADTDADTFNPMRTCMPFTVAVLNSNELYEAYSAYMRETAEDGDGLSQAVCNVRARLHNSGGIIWAVSVEGFTSHLNNSAWVDVCIFDYDSSPSPRCGNYGSCNADYTKLGRLAAPPPGTGGSGVQSAGMEAFYVHPGSCGGPNPHPPFVTKSPSSAPSTSPSLPPSPPTPKPTPAPHEHASEPMPVWLIVIMVTVVAIIVVVAVWMVCRGRSETATYNSVAGGLNHLL